VENLDTKQEGDSISQCLNCQELLLNSQKYCPSCGQRTTASILSLKGIVSNFLSNTFYLDSKLWKSFGKLFIPAKSTIQYVQGKRKKYLHPFRLFFVSAILFFTIINVSFSKILEDTIGIKSYTQELQAKLELYDRRSQLVDSLDLRDTGVLNHINYVGGLVAEESEMPADTLFPFISMANTGRDNGINALQKKISNRDFFELTADEILEKYKVEGWWTRYNLKQSLRMSHNPLGVIKFILNNFIWGVFIIVAVCGWILKLLHFKRRKTYVEALLLLLEVHTIGFFISSLAVLIDYNLGATSFNRSIGISLFLTFIYSVFMLKRYYKENILWTLLKSLVFAISYIIVFTIFMTITSFIVVGFF